MKPVKVLFPATEEENQLASKLYAEGKAASGTDPQQGLEDETTEEGATEEQNGITPPKMPPTALSKSLISAGKAMLKTGYEYEIIDSGGKVIGIIHVLGQDSVGIFDPNDGHKIKDTTIERATQAAKEKGHTFRRR